MSFLRRMISSDYRKALAAEAQGDFVTAARHYALCGETGRVADMHLAHARSEQSASERVRALRSALDFAKAGDSRRPMVLRLLARALRERARAERCSDCEKRELLLEAATVFEEGESWEPAAECHLELGDRTRAAAAYSRAGMVERVEEVLSAQEREEGRLRQEDSLFRDYELMLQGGQRDEAAEALRGCIEAASQKGEYRRLLAEIEARLLRGGRVELEAEGRQLIIIGHLPLVIGREADCDLQARGPSVSRHHARVQQGVDSGFTIADCGSRNGTKLNGLPIAGELPLSSSGAIELGESCQLDYSASPAGSLPPLLRLEVTRGMDRGRLALASTSPLELGRLVPGAPALTLTFSCGRPFAEAASGLQLNGARVGGRVQLIQGDAVTHDGRTVRVLS